jgi:L-ascorbate metabolism protein UlaG (beta-lactamase superfamily)
VTEPAVVYPRGDAGALSATWVGHSTVLLQLGNLNVITDPVFSPRAFPVQWAGPRRVMEPGLSLDALPPLDLVLLSHNHYDHLDRPAVKRLVSEHPDAAWVGPLGVAGYVGPWGVRNLIELDWWQEISIKGVRVTGIGAYDPRWFMQVVHMNAEEAVRVYQDVVAGHPGAALPLMLGIHWGTFRLTTEPMDEPPRRATVQWREAGLDPGKLWIANFGETREVKGILAPSEIRHRSRGPHPPRPGGSPTR